jgi:orotidine-5'-phosphate decarboxylase
LGAPGRDALQRTVEHARAAGLLVIADAKRGDIDVTAAAYADALFDGAAGTPFGDIEGLRVDLATINPYMGADTLAPLLTAARARGAGILVLVRTSNPGASDFMDVELAGGGTLWERVAALVDSLGQGEPIADVGAVVGATAPWHIGRMRELMPRTPFLLPGIGAQGGEVDALGAAFAPGPAGGLVSASRSIANAGEGNGSDPAAAARAEAERLRAVAWALA